MNRVRVILSAATTIDGKIATRTGDSAISSHADRVRLHRLRAAVDAILVGTTTMMVDDPLLNARYADGPDPVRVILDPAGKIPSDSQILATCETIPTILVVSGRISATDQDRIGSFPVHIIKTDQADIPVRWLVTKLAEHNIRTLLVEGGGNTNWRFLEADIVDEVILTVSPHMVGGDTSMIRGKGLDRISESPKMRLKSVTRQGDEVVLHYVRGSAS